MTRIGSQRHRKKKFTNYLLELTSGIETFKLSNIKQESQVIPEFWV